MASELNFQAKFFCIFGTLKNHQILQKKKKTLFHNLIGHFWNQKFKKHAWVRSALRQNEKLVAKE